MKNNNLKATSTVARELNFNSKDFFNFLVKYKILIKIENGYKGMEKLENKAYVDYRIFENGKQTVYWTESGQDFLKKFFGQPFVSSSFSNYSYLQQKEREKNKKKNTREYFKKRKEFQEALKNKR